MISLLAEPGNPPPTSKSEKLNPISLWNQSSFVQTYYTVFQKIEKLYENFNCSCLGKLSELQMIQIKTKIKIEQMCILLIINIWFIPLYNLYYCIVIVTVLILTAQSKTSLADSTAVLKAVASKQPLPTWKLHKIHKKPHYEKSTKLLRWQHTKPYNILLTDWLRINIPQHFRIWKLSEGKFLIIVIFNFNLKKIAFVWCNL